MPSSEPASSPPPRGRRFRRPAILLVLLLGAATTLRLTVFRPRPVPVTVFRVAAGTVEETVTNSRSGTIEAKQEATLSPETGGRVAEIFVREGETVRRGQPLLRLADADLEAQERLAARSLDATRAGEREACDAAALAGRELERQRDLARQGIASSQLIDQLEVRRDAARSACEAAAAGTRQAAAALDLARAQRDRTLLRAPFGGLVAEIATEIGEWITPSPPGIPIPPVLRLFDPDGIHVSAPLDEVDVARVEPGLPVRITLDSFPERSFAGRVTRVAPFVLDQLDQNRTFEVEVAFDDAAAARKIPPGASADVEIIRGRHDGVLRVPTYAVLGGTKVLLVRDDRLVEADVTIGLRNWAFAEVTKGLAEGDVVVVSLDRPEVKAGARVLIEGESTK